jgi:hypothetical protein
VNESTYLGVLLEVDFTCPSEPVGGLRLALFDDARLRSESGGTISGSILDDELTINCVEPPPPPLVGGTQADLADAAASSNATGAIAGAGAAAAIVLAGVAWNVRRRIS